MTDHPPVSSGEASSRRDDWRLPPHIVEHNAVMFDRFGYRPTSIMPCPRVVVTRQCYARSWDGAPSTRPACLCVRYRALLDHARIWTDPRGLRVLTAEPYGTTDASLLLGFVTECRALGLWVSVDADSPWCPGWTVLIRVQRRTTTARRA